MCMFKYWNDQQRVSNLHTSSLAPTFSYSATFPATFQQHNTVSTTLVDTDIKLHQLVILISIISSLYLISLLENTMTTSPMTLKKAEILAFKHLLWYSYTKHWLEMLVGVFQINRLSWLCKVWMGPFDQWVFLPHVTLFLSFLSKGWVSPDWCV